MATLRKNRGLQWPLLAEFTFDLAAADAMANVAGVLTSLNVAGSSVYDVAGLPPGATLIGGDMVVEVVSNDAGTATVAIGDSTSATRYLAATNIKALARTALTLTGYRGVGEDLRMTVANATGGATTGKVTIRALYTVQGRTNETQPA